MDYYDINYELTYDLTDNDDINYQKDILKCFKIDKYDMTSISNGIEKMCEFFSSLGRTKHTVIRHSNTYGPHDKYDLEKSHMFGATITKVMNAEDGDEIVVWGDGSTERDYTFIEDIVQGIGLVNGDFLPINEELALSDLRRKIQTGNNRISRTDRAADIRVSIPLGGSG